jgi:AcrR family transcriptional regulator
VNTSTAADAAQPSGRQRLIEAAMRLAAREGAILSTLGLREIAREAGLNHNTFYRHFEDQDDLGRAAAEAIAAQLRQGLGQIRRNSARHADATTGAVSFFLDFARDNAELISVGLREVHCQNSPMRRILQRMLDDIAADNVEQILGMDLVPGLGREPLGQATAAITYYMFYRALDYIERPRKRAEISAEIVAFIRAQFLGRIALEKGRAR